MHRRIKLEFVIEKPPAYFPLNNHPWAAIIYNALEEANSDYANFLHNEGYHLDPNKHGSKANKRLKPFVFSRPEIPNCQIVNGKLYTYSQVVKWQISSPIPEFIDSLASGLKKQAIISIYDRKTQEAYKNKEIDSSKATLILSKINHIQSPIFTSKMRFTALSPITVCIDSAERKKIFLRPDSEEFSKIIKNNLIEKYELLNKRPPKDCEFSFDLDWDYICQKFNLEYLETIKDLDKKLEVKRLSTNKVSKLVQYEQINIKSYLAPFIVSGNPELISVGWDWGFGNCNSQGFGMAQFSPKH
ncbi:MAG: CRISPR-associated endoribonuclease Cas6 [Acidobacteria bacterium]|nr:CRISPR-associated endoribonuclease Cas6 [Acidobacteriota bacterium]